MLKLKDKKNIYKVSNQEKKQRAAIKSQAIKSDNLTLSNREKYNIAMISTKITSRFRCINIICIPESFNTNISHQPFDNFCEFTAPEHKFKLLLKTGFKRSS